MDVRVKMGKNDTVWQKLFNNKGVLVYELIMEKGYDTGDIPEYSDLPHTESWVKD